MSFHSNIHFLIQLFCIVYGVFMWCPGCGTVRTRWFT